MKVYNVLHPGDGRADGDLDITQLVRDWSTVRGHHRYRARQHPHTTCALFVNEFQSALIDDLRSLMRLVPERDGYRHDDPRVSDCERGNAHSHLRAALLGRNIAVGVNNGELTLGRFQSVIFAELDGPRKREISIQVIGEEWREGSASSPHPAP
jgi:secondary thiamine-phosphate synthase enzyme